MELALIRHFPTMGNRLRQYIGSTDEPLDMEAVESLKEQLGNFENIYPQAECVTVSPMKRCVQTAGLLYPGCELLFCEKLRECDFGDFERKTYEQLKDHPAYKRWLDSGGLTAFPKGESRAEFQKRCIEGLEEMIEVLMERGVKRAAFVVHGGTIMSVLSEFDKEKREFYHWQVKNGKGYIACIEEESWKQGKHIFREIKEL